VKIPLTPSISQCMKILIEMGSSHSAE